MELIETCFLTSVVIYHKSVTLDWMEVLSISPLMVVSKSWAYAKYSV